ncbi:hypothetical protein RQP46_006447 [Phenoliferia psychrophenolica]
MAGGGGGGARGSASGVGPAMAMAPVERRTNSTSSKRKPTPATEQDLYYANAPPPPPSHGDYDASGFAGVGALGRSMTRPDASSETPYGGLDESLQPTGTEGGYAVATQMIQDSQRNSQRLASQNSPHASPRLASPVMMGGSMRRPSPPSEHHTPPTSIPYIPANNANGQHSNSSLPYSTPPGLGQSPERGSRVTPPSLTGVWPNNPNEEVRGPLRVTNDESDASDSEVLSGPWHDADQGSSGGAYSRESLTAGLTYGTGQASHRAPTYPDSTSSPRVTSEQ